MCASPRSSSSDSQPGSAASPEVATAAAERVCLVLADGGLLEPPRGFLGLLDPPLAGLWERAPAPRGFLGLAGLLALGLLDPPPAGLLERALAARGFLALAGLLDPAPAGLLERALAARGFLALAGVPEGLSGY